MSGDCILPTFASPHFSGMMPGARYDGKSSELSAVEMPCCSGTGVRMVDRDGRGSMARCDLKSRAASAREVLKKYHDRWDINNFPIEMTASPEEQRLILQRLALFRSVDIGGVAASRGLGFCTRPHEEAGPSPGPSPGPRPGPVWWAAVAAAWRFGFKTHIVDMDEARRGPLLPPRTWQDDGRRGAVFIDRVGGLWDPGLAQEMETLIGFCARSGIPLWIARQEVAVADPEQQDGKLTDFAKAEKSRLSTKAAFKRRLTASRNRSWDSWFREVVRDRLREAVDPF